jgi:hypothetical protein
MTQQELFKNLTSSAEASPASRSVLQASKKARKTIDTSGHTCMQLLNQRNPLGSLSKTLVASSMWHSMMCVLTWKPKVTPRNRLLFQLAVSKLPTKETESGSSESLWPTPTTQEIEHPGRKADGDRQETIEGWQEQSQLGSSRSSEDVGNTDNLGSLLSPHETKREGSTSRHSEGELERGSSDVANAQSNGEDGVLRTTEPKHDQGDTRMESSSSSDGRSERGISQDVANSKELEYHEHDNGERTQQDREHRVSQQPRGEGSLGGTEDVADSKLVSSDSISDSGSNTKTESEQGQKTGNLDRSSGRQDVANSKELRNYEHDNGERTQQDREHRVSQQPRGEGSLGGTEDVADTERLGQQGQGELERPGNTAQDSDGQTGGSNDGRQGSTGQGHTQSELGRMADGIPTRLDGHLGFEREPNIPRVATGIPDRVNRLKALGNSIVPQIVYNIGLAILEEEKRNERTL